MNKRTQERIEKAFIQTKHQRSYAYDFAVSAEDGGSIMIDINHNDEPLSNVVIADNYTIDAIVTALSEEITNATQLRDAAREAAELARISQPATPAEQRSFRAIVDHVTHIMRHYSQSVEETQRQLASGRTLSAGQIDTITQSTGRYEAAVRVWSIAKRNETIKKSLRDIINLTDSETGFFNPNNSSSNAANVLNAYATSTYIEFGQMARGRERF